MVLLNSSTCNFDWKPKNFNFKSIQEQQGSFYNSSGINGILVMFICNHCPYVKAIEEKISIETDRIKKLNVNSIAIMSNDQSSYIEDSDDGLREQIKRANFNFPYIVDSTQELGKMFEARCTPEFYYFNNLTKLKYRGRLDSDGKNSSMGKPELYYAIEETISKGYCSTRQYPSIGCSIKWKN